SAQPAKDPSIVTAENASAQELYQQGIRQMRAGDKGAAYESFLQAYNSGEELSAHQKQQLQEKIRACAPEKAVKQASAQLEVSGPQLDLEPKALDQVVRKNAALYDQHREEVTNTIFRAE